MRKIIAVITARASYSRIKQALLLLNERPDVALEIYLSASAAEPEYGDVARQVLEDGLPLSGQLYTLCREDSLAGMVQTTAQSTQALGAVFARSKPDAVITIADRYETMATALAAAYQNIPLIHIQGGEVTGNIDEKVRHAITKLADIHIVCTPRAREYLIRMGEIPERIVVSGCPSCDLAEMIRQRKHLSRDMLSKYTTDPRVLNLREKEYCVVLYHAVTDEQQQNARHVRQLFDVMAQQGKTALWILPNVDAGSEEIRRFIRESNAENICPVHALDNLDFLELLRFSRGIIGNSSVGIRECSYLGVPAVNIGSRQFGRERGENVIDCGNSPAEIRAAVEKMWDMQCAGSTLYGSGHAAQIIAETIATCQLTYQKTLHYVAQAPWKETP